MNVQYKPIERFFEKEDSLVRLNNVFLTDKGMTLYIGYAYSGDLVMTVYGGESVPSANRKYEKRFVVPNTDEYYPIFLNLYNNIINVEIMGHKRDSEKDRERYEKFRASVKRFTQPKLVKYGRVIWQSDDEPWNLANKLILDKTSEGIELTFESRKEYSNIFRAGERDFIVNVSNSGSRYEPFNLCFVQLIRELQPQANNEGVVHSETEGFSE
ncbi:MAG: hypothetical protein J6J23_05280 [Clostridia bacterium]|nr:hypothetical protein [Clostridia bacterium]